MTRLISIVGLLVALSGNVWAATTVTVAGVSGPEAKVGREGAWRTAKEGATIGEKEFLAIPAGATVRVTLPDGKVASFDGKLVVPGRRLVADKTSASNVAWLARAIQNASDAVGGVAEGQDGPGAAKPENVGSRPEQSVKTAPEGGGSRVGGSTLGATNEDAGAAKTTAGRRDSKATSGPVVAPAPPPETSSPVTPPHAERERDVASTAANDEAVMGESKEAAKAIDSSRSVVADAVAVEAAPPATARTESLRSGLAAESEGNFETARLALTKAAAKGAKSEGDVRATRAEAYVALGRVHLQLGNLKAAALSFDQAIRLDTVNGKTGPHAARAHYLLGIAALERGDMKEARRKFGLLSGYPALDAAAKKALSELRH